jgi:molybdopterin-guanine dinucleotide biosynthesis protein A
VIHAEPSPMTGVILAGGRGARLGGSKAALRLGNETLLERTGRLLRESFGTVVVVAGDRNLRSLLPWADVIADEVENVGPMGGLHAALRHIRTEHAFVVGCDMPRLEAQLIAAQARLARGADIVVPRHDGLLEPLHAIYGKGCLPAIERQIASGDYRLRSIFGQVRTVYLDLLPSDPFGDIFTNINSHVDLQRMGALPSRATWPPEGRRIS